jgi:hypothetical protein
VGSTGGFLHAEQGGPLAHVRDVGAGHSLSRAGQLGRESMGRQPRVQLEPAQVVLEDVGASAIVGQSHPHNLIEAARTAQG